MNRLSLLLIVFAVIGLCLSAFFMLTLTREEMPVPSPVSTVDDGEANEQSGEGIPAISPAKAPDWPTYHGNSSLTGAVSTMLPVEPIRLWLFDSEDAVYHAPVSAGDRIFFSTI
jgi:hypothetical protein